MSKKCNHKKMVIALLSLFFFFLYTKVQIHMYDNKYLPGKIFDEIRIISYGEVKEHSTKYLCKNSLGDKFVIYFPANIIFQKGDRIQISGDYELPNLARNTGGFNYRRYYNSQKIFGNIYVKDYYLTAVKKFHPIYWIQDEVYKCFGKLFPKNEMGLILGMLIGETKDITEDTLQAFQQTGITHLIAVSGSNVMYVLACVQFVFQKICGKRKTYFISIGFLIVFMLVSRCFEFCCKGNNYDNTDDIGKYFLSKI